MTWQDDYYPGSSDYPTPVEDPEAFDPWSDPLYARAEDVGDES